MQHQPFCFPAHFFSDTKQKNIDLRLFCFCKKEGGTGWISFYLIIILIRTKPWMQLCSVYVVYIYIILWEFLTIFKSIGTKAFSQLLLRASPSLGQLSLVSVVKWSNIFFLYLAEWQQYLNLCKLVAVKEKLRWNKQKVLLNGKLIQVWSNCCHGGWILPIEMFYFWLNYFSYYIM